MGCIWYALDRLNIKVNKRYSCEIDKYANQANNAAYPDTIQLGDVTKVKAEDLAKIDLFVGGSPCQGFSFAGKQLNFNDPRSALFFEFVRIWNEIKKINPNAKFLLENVNMKKEHLRVISEYMGVFPVRINSNLVSAQNRDRWYWTNIRTKETGLFSELWSDIPQPKDKGILLKDILQPESEVDEKYYIKNPKIGFDGMSLNQKCNTLRTGGKASQSAKHNYDIIKVDKQGNKKADQSKAGCLTAGGHSGGNHSDMDILAIGCVKFGRNEKVKAIRKQNAKMGKKDYSPFAEKEINGIDYEKMNTITCATTKDNLLTDGYKLRRLTPRECGRLQTFTDKELDVLLSSGISDTQLYKMFGNGWTVDVIAHILSFLNTK
jgi:DNA (cytosine-5)-methyltransferase 3A